MADGKRTKPMVDGMYKRHVQYSKSPVDDALKKGLQVQQHIRVEQKRETLRNARLILSS